MRGCRAFAFLGSICIVGGPTALGAQTHHEVPPSHRHGAARIVGGNMLVGGVTAAARATLENKNPFRAFAIGALGGAVHVGGKALSAKQGATAGLAGLTLGAVGTSIVANAGRGDPVLSELFLAVGPLRVRVSTRSTRRVRIGLNLYEVAIAGRQFAREGIEIEWSRTLASGTFVFVTRDRYIRVAGGDTVSGIAVGPAIVIDGYRGAMSATLAHELTHAHQYWFGQEAIVLPLEEYLRTRIPGVRHTPSWIELGVLVPALWATENAIFGRRAGPANRLIESEAYWFTR
jgi:hypothetical protein